MDNFNKDIFTNLDSYQLLSISGFTDWLEIQMSD